MPLAPTGSVVAILDVDKSVHGGKRPRSEVHPRSDLPSATNPAKPRTVESLSTRQDIIELAREARGLRRRKFVKTHPGLFLLARPDDEGDDYDDDDEMEFDTVAVPLSGGDQQVVHEWLALPLQWPSDAAPGHRLSLGRAPGCDLVIRMSFVSKMHAYIELVPGESLSVGDHRSANGTRHNGRAIEPNERVPLALGDWLKIGTLSLQLVDAERLHRALNSAAFAAWEVEVAASLGAQ